MCWITKNGGLKMEKPKKLDTFMYALIKEASRYSLVDFLEAWDITIEEYYRIKSWFKNKFGIDFY